MGCGPCCLVVLCAVRCNVGGEVKWKGTDVCLIALHLVAHVGGTKQQYHIICAAFKQLCNILIVGYAPCCGCYFINSIIILIYLSTNVKYCNPFY